MVTEKDVEFSIQDYIRKHSGFEANRPYIGFSHVGQCPKRTYRDYMTGFDASDQKHRMAWAGYSFERLEREMLEKIGILTPNSQAEIFSDFSSLFKGHTDGETSWGDLMEIKSVTCKKYDIVNATHRALQDHFRQVQLYMHYGSYKRTWMDYVCRETMEHRVICVHYSAKIALEGVAWGQAMVQAVEEQIEPACLCGKCK